MGALPPTIGNLSSAHRSMIAAAMALHMSLGHAAEAAVLNFPVSVRPTSSTLAGRAAKGPT